MPHADVSPKMRDDAKAMRRVMTPAEKRLWGALRAHRLDGLSFRRQLPVGPYIADFACPSEKLIVELDGLHHAERHVGDDDSRRDEVLSELGWTVIRFWNDDVMHDLAGACAHILAIRNERSPK